MENELLTQAIELIKSGKKAEAKIPNVKIELKELSLWNPILSCMNDPNSKVNKTIAVTETLPSILVENCMLFMMREGIKPTWEDPNVPLGPYTEGDPETEVVQPRHLQLVPGYYAALIIHRRGVSAKVAFQELYGAMEARGEVGPCQDDCAHHYP